jgi:signal transduction histidine kinase
LGDETLLRRVVQNLLSNAVKFTPAVLFNWRLSHLNEVIVSVIDACDVPPEERERIFEKFGQVKVQNDKDTDSA